MMELMQVLMLINKPVLLVHIGAAGLDQTIIGFRFNPQSGAALT